MLLVSSTAACSRNDVVASIERVERLGPGRYRVVERWREVGLPWYEFENRTVTRAQGTRTRDASLSRGTAVGRIELGAASEEVASTTRAHRDLGERPSSCNEFNVYSSWSVASSSATLAHLCAGTVRIFDRASGHSCDVDVSSHFGLPDGFRSSGAAGALALRIQASGGRYFIYASADPRFDAKGESPVFNADLADKRHILVGVDDHCVVDRRLELELPTDVFVRTLGSERPDVALLFDRSGGSHRLVIGTQSFPLSPEAGARLRALALVPDDYLIVDDGIGKIVGFESAGSHARMEVVLDFAKNMDSGPTPAHRLEAPHAPDRDQE
jgi:hypothetical protein